MNTIKDTREGIIRVENITVNYREKDIWKGLKKGRHIRGIENISFEVHKGEIFSIIGLNGAGKTSTMKCILGLIKPDKGRVKVLGKEKMDSRDFERVGYLPEISYYPKSMKLKDLMMYYCELYNMPKREAKEKTMAILEELGIGDRLNDRLEGFSKGMLQKVGLAQAVVNEPDILFLDEPMSGLDPLARQNVVNLIKRLRDRGTTVFFNTHILADVADIGDRIAVIHEGKLIDMIDMKSMRTDHRYLVDVEIQKNNNNDDGDSFKEFVIDKDELNERLEEFISRGDKIVRVEKMEFSLKEYFIKAIGGVANE